MQIILGGIRGVLVGGVIGALAGGLFLVALVFPFSLGSPIVPLIGVGGGAIGGVVGGMMGGVTGQKRLTFWGGGGLGLLAGVVAGWVIFGHCWEPEIGITVLGLTALLGGSIRGAVVCSLDQ
jgi:hypothetical protein